MPNPQIYTDELQLFQNKYNLKNYDLKNLDNFDQEFGSAVDFLNETETKRTPAVQFTDWAVRTMSIYFAENTQLNEKGEYLSSFNMQAFLTDFEKLADAKYRSELKEGQESNRGKYAGATEEGLTNALGAKLNVMDKTLPTLWKERLKKGLMDLDKLQTVTSNAVTAMLDRKADRTKMAGNLTNVVAAHEAMKQLRESRKGFLGWFWKIFHLGMNAEEKEYMQRLDNAINSLQQNGYKVEKVRAGLTDKTVMGKNLAGQENKPVKIEPVAKIIDDKFKNLGLKKVFIHELLEKLPDNGKVQMVRESFITLMVSSYFVDQVKALNRMFDEGLALGKDPKEEMKSVVQGIFQCAVQASNGYDSSSAERKLEVIKIMTKVGTELLTAASLYPEELGGVIDGYIEQTVAEYAERKDNAMENANNQQNLDNNREQVFDNDKLFVANNVDQSAPVEQPNQINGLSIDKK